jgi:hypothetical protein
MITTAVDLLQSKEPVHEHTENGTQQGIQCADPGNLLFLGQRHLLDPGHSRK